MAQKKILAAFGTFYFLSVDATQKPVKREG